MRHKYGAGTVRSYATGGSAGISLPIAKSVDLWYTCANQLTPIGVSFLRSQLHLDSSPDPMLRSTPPRKQEKVSGTPSVMPDRARCGAIPSAYDPGLGRSLSGGLLSRSQRVSSSQSRRLL